MTPTTETKPEAKTFSIRTPETPPEGLPKRGVRGSEASALMQRVERKAICDAVMDAMVHAGLELITVRYSGYGDSGDIQDVMCRRRGSEDTEYGLPELELHVQRLSRCCHMWDHSQPIPAFEDELTFVPYIRYGAPQGTKAMRADDALDALKAGTFDDEVHGLRAKWATMEYSDDAISLESFVQDAAFDIIEEFHGGYENNEGGHGELRFDARTCSVELEHKDNYVTTIDTDTVIMSNGEIEA